MKYVLLCVSFFLLFGDSFPRPILPLQIIKDLNFVTSYFNKFYPLPTLDEQIKAMQRFWNMSLTGIIDNTIRKIMELPRCGRPDVQQQLSEPVWPKKDLTYRIINYTPDLPKAKVDEIMPAALKVWGDVTPLTFRRVSKRSDIEIAFAYRAHGDGNSFDAEGGTLAHAFVPGNGLGGDAHFDESERWSVNNKGVNLFIVAVHEFGHSLGLNHSNVKGAVMFPTYSYSDTFQLTADDIRRIQKLYGKRK